MSIDQMDNFLSGKLSNENKITVTGQPNSGAMTNEERTEVFFKRLQELGYNLTELRPVLEQKGNTLIIAGAGAGKTTALILKIIYDLVTGETLVVETRETEKGVQKVVRSAPIYVGTFLKSGAKELQLAFDSWIERLKIVDLPHDRVRFGTLHSEYYDILKIAGYTPDLDGDFSSMLRRVCNKYSIRSNNSYSKGLTVDDMRDIECIITYVRNRLDEKRYEHPLMSDFNLDSHVVSVILDEFKLLRREANKSDFEELQEIIYDSLVKYPKISRTIKSRYKFLYFDEFQDTSQIQWEILKHYIDGAEKVIAIGDDDQTIYGWRGSDIDIIVTKFEEYVRITKNSFNICELTTNYRCGENILKPVIPSIIKNTNRHPKELKSGVEGGEVTVISNSSVNHLVSSVKQDLTQFTEINGKREWWKVGILSRTNQDLLMPAILLELDGNIKYALSKSVGFNGRIPRQVLGVMDLIVKRYTKDFAELLKMFLPRFDAREADMLTGILEVNKKYSFLTIPDNDLQYSCKTLYTLRRNILQIYGTGSAEESINAYIYLLQYMLVNVYTGKTAYAQKARDFVTFIIDLLENHEKFRGMHLLNVEQMFNLTLASKLEERIMKDSVSRVKLSTVHEAKGKEWDSVYIWNDTNGTFPASVGNRELSEDEFEEERRVHYIAWSRARSKLTVFTNEKNRGVFLNECDLSSIKEIDMKDKSISLTGKTINNKLAQLISEYIASRLQLFLSEKMDKTTTEWLSFMRMASNFPQTAIKDIILEKTIRRLADDNQFNTRTDEDKATMIRLTFEQVLESESE